MVAASWSEAEAIFVDMKMSKKEMGQINPRSELLAAFHSSASDPVLQLLCQARFDAMITIHLGSKQTSVSAGICFCGIPHETISFSSALVEVVSNSCSCFNGTKGL